MKLQYINVYVIRTNFESFFSIKLTRCIESMTVQPFAYAELSDVWNNAPDTSKQDPKWSLCDLASQSKHVNDHKELLPTAFAKKTPEENVLFGGGSANKKQVSRKKVRFADKETLSEIETFQNKCKSLDNSELLQMGMFITTAVLMVFTMDQFTRIGMNLRYL